MALHADWTVVDDWQGLHQNDQEKCITETLAFAMIPIGISKITEKNVDEFFMRVSMYERVFGSFLNIGATERPFTFEDIHRRMGLSANVSSLTFPAFKRQIIDRLVREARRATKRERVRFDKRTADEVDV